MDDKKNIVKGIFREEDFLEFEEIENLIKEAKPIFKDNFEEKIVKNIVQKKTRKNSFFKAVIAASLMIFVLIFSTILLKKDSLENQIVESNSTLKEEFFSIFGEEELEIYDMLSIIESSKDINSKNYKTYMEYLLGENDEEDFF